MTVCKPKIIHELEKCLNEGKRIIVSYKSNTQIISLICEEIEKRGCNDIEVWYHTALDTTCKQSRAVSKREMDDVLELYHLYDFSDRVFVISDTEQYGSLLNYMKNVISTREEMVDAILYGK